jgi:fumarate reductase (CoM/CoB) subunit A
VEIEEIETDVLVAGSGVGGIMAAYRAQAAGARVVLLGGSGGASSRISSMNTALDYCDEDVASRVFDDMFRAGGYLNDPAVVSAFARRIGPETRHLADLGVPFAREDGRLARRQATGSTWTRAVYSMGLVGVDISRVLMEILTRADSGTTVVGGALLVNLDVADGHVAGGLSFSPRDDRWLRIRARSVVLATGGAGQIFDKTTNPRGSRGTGYALALEAGATLTGMEFVSFEPFVSTFPEDVKGDDLPTTVLREGAKLRNGRGDEFLDTREAPTKDIICRAMVREVREGRGTASGSVYYDIREMDPAVVDRYVQIKEALRSRHLVSTEAQIEVMPAQHFLMGGIQIDGDAAADVPGLFAVGEVAGGAHGAHRLAAGGGMEVVAGGAVAGDGAARYALENPHRHTPASAEPMPDHLGQRLSAEDAALMQRIKTALQEGCGILRTGDQLAASVGAIEEVLDTVSHSGNPFIRRSALVALAIAVSSQLREESRGDHFREDFPRRDDSTWMARINTSLHEGGLRFSKNPIFGVGSGAADERRPVVVAAGS